VRVVVTVLLVIMMVLSLMLSLDESAMNLHNEAFERSVVAFGLAKGLNAVISLIQGTELSFTPVGIGLNFSIGEVLDPLNDMVERFSWVMLFASVSLGVQKLILILSSKLFLHVALFISISLSLFLIWKHKVANQSYMVLSFRILFFILLLRFSAIIFVYSSELLYNSLLYEDYKSSSAVLQTTKSKFEEIQNKNKEITQFKKESQWYEVDIGSKYQNLKSHLNIQQQLDALKQNIEEASINIINLITIFIVQSLIMPLLFLWFFIISVKWIFRVRVNEVKINALLNKSIVSV